ncbi:hypothetical protein BOTBODRAFT_508636 [Botryobasidium botryosum FD-172 SS1]|uniref:Uncharacterized protein n=1 Tax=Botryobasidium botryosum (strain FD-172 SS1) TaxID=930990 RepID=A0A067MUB9_BOTB1|nr:hypothetical protein BOTBODRAFT_508636 [Botryobasidium botryosum FD-172 SS1]
MHIQTSNRMVGLGLFGSIDPGPRWRLVAIRCREYRHEKQPASKRRHLCCRRRGCGECNAKTVLRRRRSKYCRSANCAQCHRL